MRKGTMRVFEAWKAGKPDNRQNSIWTDGGTVYSYGTAILTHGEYLNEVALNRTTYSKTTTTHQNGLAVLVAHPQFSESPHEFNVVEVDRVPIGANSDKLFRTYCNAQGY